MDDDNLHKFPKKFNKLPMTNLYTKLIFWIKTHRDFGYRDIRSHSGVHSPWEVVTQKGLSFQILKLMCLNVSVCNNSTFPTLQCQASGCCQFLPTNRTPLNCAEYNKGIITYTSKQYPCQLRLFIETLPECRLVDKNCHNIRKHVQKWEHNSFLLQCKTFPSNHWMRCWLHCEFTPSSFPPYQLCWLWCKPLHS